MTDEHSWASPVTLDPRPFFDAFDTDDDPGMSHWMNDDNTRTLCGIEVTPVDPILDDEEVSDCVVCHDLWLQM